jgi:hypothetical protein
MATASNRLGGRIRGGAMKTHLKTHLMTAAMAALVGLAMTVPTSAQTPVFPSAIDAKFEKEKPTRARLHTCAAQYKANKANNANGGLKWVQKGGGYWSQCNKKLMG